MYKGHPWFWAGTWVKRSCASVYPTVGTAQAELDFRLVIDYPEYYKDNLRKAEIVETE